jgi:hypothetical protein
MRASFIALAVFGVCLAAIRPFGNYPLNDDWQYARAAKLFAESGSIRIDTAIAPALVGQLLMAYPVIRLFGMNHAFLRVLTWVMAALSLFCIDRLLKLAGVFWRWRLFTLLVLIANPLFLYFANSFMTEFFGFAPALGAAVVYFEYRRKGSPTAAGWVIVALLSVFSFWIRQFAALVFPAIALTWFLANISSMWRSPKVWVPAGVSCAIFGFGIGAYFLWWGAHAPKFGFAFSDPLTRMFHMDSLAWGVETGAALVYFTGFFLPMLILAPGGRWRNPAAYVMGAALVGCALVTRSWLRLHAPSDFVFDWWFHRVFPYLTNVIFRTGIGPITLDDVYHQADTARPQWSSHVWSFIEWTLLIATPLWGFVFRRIPHAFKPSGKSNLLREIAIFSAVWGVLSWIVTVQAYGTQMFDRYYFPIILCLSILLPLLLNSGAKDVRPGRHWDYILAAVCTVALGWFSVAGVHDYFRWNDARWDLVRFAFRQHVSPATLAAGYEVNGWENYDNYVSQNGQMSPNCRVNYDDFFCSDASYRIGMNEIPGYDEWWREQPSYWLASGPPVRLLYHIGAAAPPVPGR